MERCRTGARTRGEPRLSYEMQGDLFSLYRGNPGVAVPADGKENGMMDCYFRVRGAVVCMHAAAHIHGLLSGPPRTLWLGVPLKAYVPKRDPRELRALNWSNRPAFEIGVADILIPDGVVRCTTPQRTIIDLIRYQRHAGGTTTAVRCLRAYINAGGCEAQISNVADALRVSRPARVILDTLLLGFRDRL